MLVQNTPCNWQLLDPAGDCECAELAELDESTREAIEEMATTLLWNWTERRFGACETTVRPCRADCVGTGGSTFWGRSPQRAGQVGGWTPALIDGQWYNLGCGTCSAARCSCGVDESTALILPGPVAEVTEIIEHGEVLDPSAYELRGEILYRLDGKGWQGCNDEAADVYKPNSRAWQVTYLKGYAVPAGGQFAAHKLACELAKAFCGKDDCALPQRVQSITRQGVSMAILDGFEGLDEGRTGIWEIDSWISSVTHHKVTRPAVYSPDIPRGAGRGLQRGIGRGRTW